MSREASEVLRNETPLEGWKEIGAYLRRTERTAKRWEQKESLPVHRHVHDSRTTVYAYPSELNAWRARREPVAESTRSRWWRPVPAFATTIVLAVVLLTAGSGPQVGTVTAQAAEGPGIATRQVWVGADGSGRPSPDGRHFTCIDWKSGNLAIRDMETGELRLLTKEGTWDSPMQMAGSSIWSSDGKRILYYWEGPNELRILDVADPQPRVLYSDPEGRSITPIQFTADESAVLVGIYQRGGRPGQIAMLSLEDGSMRVLATMHSRGASLSPDGRYVVYDRVSEDEFPAHDLYLMRVEGGEETPLVVHPADDSLLGWIPDSEWVLFVSDRTGSSCIYAMRVSDGRPMGDPVLVKREVGKISPAGFTRDGSFYYDLVKAARDVYTMEIDPETGKVLSSPRKAILRYEGSNMMPRYSPDGKYLAYISKRGTSPYPTNRGNTLCVRSLETGEERVFYKEFGKLRIRVLVEPSWSPDSSKILLDAASDSFGLYLVDPNSGDISEVVQFPEGARPIAHLWSPDGKSIYYSRGDPDRGTRIIQRDLELGNEREIRSTSGNTGSRISLSPDGRWLAFSNNGEDKTLQVMPAEGGDARLLYRFKPRGYGVPHTWTADGRFIVFAIAPGNRGTLCRIPFEGGDVQELWPDVLSLGPISVHPGGRHITFGAATEIDSAKDIWVMENFLPQTTAARQDR